MAKIIWDQTGKRFYETGASHGVLYVMKDRITDYTNPYDTGVPWNGLTNVSSSGSGGEATALWADDIKYLNLMSTEEATLTIEAYTYPDRFTECDGTREISNGISIGQQPRKQFGFAYKTIIGNDQQSNEYGYKLHLVYGCYASPSDKSYQTINDSPEAISFSWSVSTTPVEMSGFKPTATLTIDSTKTSAAKMQAIEDIIYGRDAAEAVSAVYAPTSDETPQTGVTYYTRGGTEGGYVYTEFEGSIFNTNIKYYVLTTPAHDAVIASDPRLPLPNEIVSIMTADIPISSYSVNAWAGRSALSDFGAETIPFALAFHLPGYKNDDSGDTPLGLLDLVYRKDNPTDDDWYDWLYRGVTGIAEVWDIYNNVLLTRIPFENISRFGFVGADVMGTFITNTKNIDHNFESYARYDLTVDLSSRVPESHNKATVADYCNTVQMNASNVNAEDIRTTNTVIYEHPDSVPVYRFNGIVDVPASLLETDDNKTLIRWNYWSSSEWNDHKYSSPSGSDTDLYSGPPNYTGRPNSIVGRFRLDLYLEDGNVVNLYRASGKDSVGRCFIWGDANSLYDPDHPEDAHYLLEFTSVDYVTRYDKATFYASLNT